MNPRTVASTKVEMSEVMTPGHANFLGKVFGGSILSFIDLCAYTTASRFAGNVCVTASFDRVDFHMPIEVGEFVTFVGTVSSAGRTSVEVTIEVFAEDVIRREKRHTNTARVTMVALKDNQPTQVPKLICETKEEKVAYLLGRFRKDIRALQRKEIENLLASFLNLPDESLNSLVENPNLESARSMVAKAKES